MKKKNILIPVLATLFLVLVLYTTGSLFEMQFNPLKWCESTQFIVSFAMIVYVIIAIGTKLTND